MIFHKSDYGSFGKGFMADLDGFVGMTVEEVLSLKWLQTPTQEQAVAIGLINTLVVTEANLALREWREKNP